MKKESKKNSEKEMETEEKTEKTEIVKTRIEKIKTKDRIMTLTTRSVKQMDANDFNNHLGETLHTTYLHPDEYDLLIAYRVMNEIGKYSLLKIAQDFAMTKTMRNK